MPREQRTPQHILKSRSKSLVFAQDGLARIERRLRRVARLVALARSAAADTDTAAAARLSNAAATALEDLKYSLDTPSVCLQIAAGQMAYRGGNLIDLEAA